MRKTRQSPVLFFLSLVLLSLISCSSEESIVSNSEAKVASVAQRTAEQENFKEALKEYALAKKRSADFSKNSEEAKKFAESARNFLASEDVNLKDYSDEVVISLAIKSYAKQSVKQSNP